MIAMYLAFLGLRRHVRHVMMMVMAMGGGNHFELYASEPPASVSIGKALQKERITRALKTDYSL